MHPDIAALQALNPLNYKSDQDCTCRGLRVRRNLRRMRAPVWGPDLVFRNTSSGRQPGGTASMRRLAHCVTCRGQAVGSGCVSAVHAAAGCGVQLGSTPCNGLNLIG